MVIHILPIHPRPDALRCEEGYYICGQIQSTLDETPVFYWPTQKAFVSKYGACWTPVAQEFVDRLQVELNGGPRPRTEASWTRRLGKLGGKAAYERAVRVFNELAASAI